VDGWAGCGRLDTSRRDRFLFSLESRFEYEAECGGFQEMNLTAEARLKFDRRLRRRVGWVTESELEAELASLPDAANKVYVADEPEAPQADASPAGTEPAPTHS